MDVDQVRNVLVEYIRHVADCTGTDFLGIAGQSLTASQMRDGWTEEQIAFLETCRDEARTKDGW